MLRVRLSPRRSRATLQVLLYFVYTCFQHREYAMYTRARARDIADSVFHGPRSRRSFLLSSPLTTNRVSSLLTRSFPSPRCLIRVPAISRGDRKSQKPKWNQRRRHAAHAKCLCFSAAVNVEERRRGGGGAKGRADRLQAGDTRARTCALFPSSSSSVKLSRSNRQTRVIVCVRACVTVFPYVRVHAQME